VDQLRAITIPAHRRDHLLDPLRLNPVERPVA
jgi:hypothetical protein